MKTCKKLLALVLVLAMIFTLAIPAFAEGEAATDLTGKTVVLHTNDIHGMINKTVVNDKGEAEIKTPGSVMAYAYIAALKADFEARGANVILVDAGDFSQGSPYVSVSKGNSAVKLMSAAGYDVATLGNHEFDYGYAQLKANLKDADFDTICCNILGEDGKPVFEGSKVIEIGGVKVGFIGVNTPESQTKANPALIKGLTWLAGADMVKAVQAEADKLDADVKIVISHLGVDGESAPNRSVDLWAGLKGVDFIIDGHSHTVMTAGDNGEPIQSTGTAFANIGVIVIDNATKTIEKNYLEKTLDSEKTDATVEAAAKEIIDAIDAEYGAVFAKSDVALNGERGFNEETGLFGNRDGETNLGNLITDSMLWSVAKTGGLKVDAKHTVAITNGGGIRAAIAAGDITKKDVNTVLPFGNTVAVVYVPGSVLLEALEASTYCCPDSTIGAFPQVSGIEFVIDFSKEYDANAETYPGSTYYGPKTINRVTITSINGEAFDADATYAVVTNNFLAAGGDTYYAFAAAAEQFDTGIPMDEALMDYITTELKGVVGEQYAEPEGRTGYVYEPFTDIDGWYNDEIIEAHMMGLVKGMTATTFVPEGTVTREQYVTMLWRMCGAPEAENATLTFADAASIQDYAKTAVAWGVENGLVKGYDGNLFKPAGEITRAEMATFTYRLFEEVDASLKADAGFTDVVADEFYAEAVNVMANLEIIKGMGGTSFDPAGTATRAQAAAIMVRTAYVIADLLPAE